MTILSTPTIALLINYITYACSVRANYIYYECTLNMLDFWHVVMTTFTSCENVFV